MANADEWLDAWWTANEAGEGFAVGEDGDTPLEAAEREGWAILDRGVEKRVLAETPEGDWVLICDANGPWGCLVNADEADA